MNAPLIVWLVVFVVVGLGTVGFLLSAGQDLEDVDGLETDTPTAVCRRCGRRRHVTALRPHALHVGGAVVPAGYECPEPCVRRVA